MKPLKTFSVENALGKNILDAISKAIGKYPVSLHEPSFDGNEWIYVKECIDSTFVSSVGKFVDRFENDLAKFTGAKHAVSVVNGTAALHISLKLSGVKNGDEVLVPALTFVATANAVAYCNAIPHFVDCEKDTFGIDPAKLRDYLKKNTEQRNNLCINIKTQSVIRALILTHIFGHPAKIHEILSLARDFNIICIEDAAESIGSYYFGKHTGTFGTFGALSFNGNKTITTGGGGAILTNDEETARHAKHITTTAKLPHVWEYRHDEIGYNFRLPNINAALGCAQLERISVKINAKRRLFEAYKKAFSDIKGVTLMVEPEGCKSNYWLQTLILDENFKDERNKILTLTNNEGFMTRPSWILLNKLDPFVKCPSMNLDTAELLSKLLINIPSSPNLISFHG
jgi:perosamine synthetase